MPVTTQPAASQSAIPAAKWTLSRRSPSVTYAALRPAATQATASVVETTRGRNRSANPGAARRLTALKSGALGNGASRLTSTSRDPGEGDSSSSTPSPRTRADLPSVQNTSPLNGSAEAAAVVRDPTRRATFTATSMFCTA